jgi:AmpD protein
MIVIHHITCPPGSFDTRDIEALFLGTLDTRRHPAYRGLEGKELSAHFLIDRRGRLTQFVATGHAAFHAGVSRWRGREDCNDFSVGVELVGDAARDFTGRQYAALAALCRRLMRAHPRITPARIVGHSQVAWPRGRKNDPGPRFDWARLRPGLATPHGARPAPRPARMAAL